MIRVIATLLVLAGCARHGQDPRTVLTREMLDQRGQPTLLAELPDLSVRATLARSGHNADVQTWRSADGVSLSFREGILVSSRGLGADLMSADVSGTRAMLSGEIRGYYVRLHSYLDGEYQTVFRAYQCHRGSAQAERIVVFDRAHDTTRTEEICHTSDDILTNLYWVGSDGFVWKSKQWVSRQAGYVLTEQLIR